MNIGTLVLLLLCIQGALAVSASLQVYESGFTGFNLSFSQPVEYPRFQIFSTIGELRYSPKNTSFNSYFLIQVESPQSALLQQVYLIFNEPYAVANGQLGVGSFIVQTFASTKGTQIPLTPFLLIAIVLTGTVAFGRAGLMCMAFVQTFVISSRYSVFFKLPEEHLYKIFLFDWKLFHFDGIKPDGFINTSLHMLLLLVGIGLLSAVSFFLLRRSQNKISTIIKSVLNFNLPILMIEIMFIPLSINISRHYRLQSSLVGTPFTFIRFVSNFLCVFSILLLLSYMAFYIWIMNNKRINLQNPQISRSFHRLYNGLELRKWYTRNFHVCKLTSYFMVGLFILMPNPIYIVVIMQTIIVFLVITIRPYHLKGYTAFSCTLQTAALIEYIFVCFEALFQNLSASILGYHGTFILNAMTASLFFMIILGSIAFSSYEASVIIREKIMERKSLMQEEKSARFNLKSPQDRKYALLKPLHEMLPERQV